MRHMSIDCLLVFLSTDSIVGALGRGPKYLSDEYAIMDTRYWPTDEPAVIWISNIEVVIMIPLCFAWLVCICTLDTNKIVHATPSAVCQPC